MGIGITGIYVSERFATSAHRPLPIPRTRQIPETASSGVALFLTTCTTCATCASSQLPIVSSRVSRSSCFPLPVHELGIAKRGCCESDSGLENCCELRLCDGCCDEWTFSESVFAANTPIDDEEYESKYGGKGANW